LVLSIWLLSKSGWSRFRVVIVALVHLCGYATHVANLAIIFGAIEIMPFISWLVTPFVNGIDFHIERWRALTGSAVGFAGLHGRPPQQAGSPNGQSL
jgi:hypothetical protein